MLFEKLSEKDRDLIVDYIKAYGPNPDGNSIHGSMAPLNHLLRVWENEKVELFHLLDDQLIYSTDISYQQSESEITTALNNLLDNWYDFTTDYRVRVRNWCTQHSVGYEDGIYALYDLMSTSALHHNKVIYPINFTYTDGDKTTVFKIEVGCKIFRALKKVFKLIGMDESSLEDFRIAHSCIFNKANIHGKLHLSIHPLDYFTMSDNSSNWCSCMSWMESGDYRAGTVEMLNSPCVVIAYLNSDSVPFKFNANNEWNNKKWRELFIVTPDIISGVLGYPYNSTPIEDKVLDILRDLAKKNLGWEYQDTKYQPHSIDNYSVRFSTHYMYNDTGRENNRCIIGIDAPNNIDINYSGEWECMWCGDLSNDAYNEDDCCCNVFCGRCQHYLRCECCGHITSSDYAINFNGSIICESCYESEISNCCFCGCEGWNDEFSEIYVATIPKVWATYENGKLREDFETALSDNYSNFCGWSGIMDRQSICSECLDKLESDEIIPIYTVTSNFNLYYSTNIQIIFLEDLIKHIDTYEHQYSGIYENYGYDFFEEDNQNLINRIKTRYHAYLIKKNITGLEFDDYEAKLKETY